MLRISSHFHYVWQSLIRQLACCPVMQQLASEWTVCIIFSVRSGMLETNKQILIFKFGEDLISFHSSNHQQTYFSVSWQIQLEMILMSNCHYSSVENIQSLSLCVTKLDTTIGMLSSDAATGVRVNCLYHIFSQKWNARNKQTNFDF